MVTRKPAKKTPAKKTPVKSIDSSTLRRHLLFGSGAVAGVVVYTVLIIWLCDGLSVGDSKQINDDVAAVFNAQETLFRDMTAKRIQMLQSGALTSETASVKWMSDNYLPAAEQTWLPLLTAEKAAFGGEAWSAEDEATYIGRYIP